jgi:hypothetical protein
VIAELVDRLVDARRAWLEVERLAAELGDDELYLDVAAVRLAILGAKDRADQLRLRELDDDLEHDRLDLIAEVERELYGAGEEAAA